jgi:hypothetical protein
MVFAAFSLKENYWDDFVLSEEDIEFIYNHLLEIETPLTPQEMTSVLIEEHIQQEIKAVEQQRLSGGEVYLPKGTYDVKQQLVFPALSWRQGEVTEKRQGWNPDHGDFEVIKVNFDDGDEKEFAAGFDDHTLNVPPDVEGNNIPTAESVLASHGELLISCLEKGLVANADFVRIAFKWFPRALLLDVNTGHLNLAEALLDMAGGGPLPTAALLEQLDLSVDENPKLVEFSLDLALQEDSRFDEVGPAGEILWYLKRLEPDGVQETPFILKYSEIDYDRDLMTPEMLELESVLDDELSPLDEVSSVGNEISVPLLYPHWRAGTLPLTPRVRSFFPTAYETPRIRFILVDGDTGEKFSGWVVRNAGYIFGLEDWYRERELMPGTIVRISQGAKSGEVIVKVNAKRSRRDWVRTVLIGTDGGAVFATLKQIVTAAYDERLAIAIPNTEALDNAWELRKNEQPPFERTVVNMARELTKLNTQGHVHASELYAAVNLMRRCPPGPIMTLLASRPWFVHVGDLHFRFNDSEMKK